ncbi:Immunoglobulin I-set [Trinorchestia longiramus]|nr:Immunoglobulin I-set [Trinorchestia longiramus]
MALRKGSVLANIILMLCCIPAAPATPAYELVGSIGRVSSPSRNNGGPDRVVVFKRSPTVTAPSSSQPPSYGHAAPLAATSSVFSYTLAGPGLAAMFTPPPSFQNNDITPSFGDTTPTNVTVITGRMAELKCAVNNLGTKSVSWVRHQDIHVLTVGRITFTNDDRFVAHNTPGSNVWSLRIKFPQARDSGKYECQVSIRPPLARVVQLNVVGQVVTRCRGDKVVTFDGSREGVQVRTTKGTTTTSVLSIADVRLQDSGVYICSPEGMREASVTLTVLHGELPQAMQTGSTCRTYLGSHVLLLLIAVGLVGLPYLLLPATETWVSPASPNPRPFQARLSSSSESSMAGVLSQGNRRTKFSDGHKKREALLIHKQRRSEIVTSPRPPRDPKPLVVIRRIEEPENSSQNLKECNALNTFKNNSQLNEEKCRESHTLQQISSMRCKGNLLVASYASHVRIVAAVPAVCSCSTSVVGDSSELVTRLRFISPSLVSLHSGHAQPPCSPDQSGSHDQIGLVYYNR